MKNTILRWLAYTLTIIFIAWLIPGISVSGFVSAAIACVIIAFINALIKPFLQIITMPINILTLGFFTLILNALLFMLAGAVTPGFNVNGFWSALIGSVILSIFAQGIEKIGHTNSQNY